MAAIATESFNKADSTTLGPDQTWVEVTNDFAVLSNQAHPVSLATATLIDARCSTDLATANGYVQAIVPVLSADAAGVAAVGIAFRFANAAQTYYCLQVNKSSGAPNGHWYLESVSAGVETVIQEADYTYATNDVLYLSCIGSTITAKINGTTLASVTNTTLTTGTKAGIIGYRLLTADDSRLDSWEAGTPPVVLTGQGNAASAGSGNVLAALTLAGQGNASSAGAGDAGKGIAVDGHGDASSAGAGDLLAALTLAGQGNAASTGTADALLAATLAGQGNAASTGTADSLLAAALAGQGNAASTGVADVTITSVSGSAVALDGHGDAASTGTADLVVTVDLQGQGNAASTGTADLIVTLDLTGQGNTASSGTADLILTVALDGHGDAASTGTAAVLAALTLAGQGNASSTGQLVSDVVTAAVEAASYTVPTYQPRRVLQGSTRVVYVYVIFSIEAIEAVTETGHRSDVSGNGEIAHRTFCTVRSRRADRYGPRGDTRVGHARKAGYRQQFVTVEQRLRHERDAFAAYILLN